MQTNRQRWLIGAVLCLACPLAGCIDYKWEYDANRAVARAREENKTLFIYFWLWVAPECGQMDRDVFPDPQVAKLFKDTVNCQLDLVWNREIAGKYGVTMAPSYVIVRPDGKRRTRTGFMPKEQFIAWAQSALGDEEAAPAPPPPQK